MAVKYRIIDKPNDRSSHVKPTIRGGGIIFPLAILAFAFFNSFAYPYFILAVMLASGISFMDDIRDMPRGLRFGIHILAALLILYQAGITTVPIILGILAFIYVVGAVNAYNFMDGINGITGFYSLAILLPLMLTEQVDINTKLQTYVLMSLVIFLFFNARKKARCFAGDVGSVSIAVIICFMLVQRIITADDYIYIGFLALYLVDTGSTFIQRLASGEKVFEAHRKHLFQLLSNEMKIPHLFVAVLYAILQLGINYILISTEAGVPGLIILFVILIPVYIGVKVMLLKKHRKALQAS
ncbi:MAG: UDP-GlcNAc--UDP-phosphate GlcNAc-1-phosphate transferase [Chitinophagaceae bacterium]|nr:UDP-GlcNAc--UDP-phosphate GlcNAc-1-phosphate transferase [Chitinophagaceae bacterium]MCB9046908.1 UDP-GlcNAc--UDP-phosphate GlcNAc-1-phosphate transferase [Chitinophagales bacterium]